LNHLKKISNFNKPLSKKLEVRINTNQNPYLMKIVLISLIMLLIGSVAYSQTDKRLKGIEKELNEVIETWETPGFAVAVVEKDRILYAKGFGYRNVENKIPVDENTLFAIGSCSKSFTTSLLGILEREGKLSLDDRPQIVAPRMIVYQRPGSGNDWKGGSITTPEKAREWVRYAASKGVQGLKLGAEYPDIMTALIDEAKKHKMGTVAHLSQTGVADMNALDAARLGLDAMTHYYGLFEALYNDADIQPWPSNMNYNDEQHRFGQVARQWNMIHPQGSEQWNALLQEFLELDFILDPTMTAYLASRDVMRARNADWHEKYTLPTQMDFYKASRTNHGSYYYNWTTWDEIAWKNFYRIWMAFLDDYKDLGGRVTVSSDAGYIYNLYGFSTIEEMELLQEAGFHPLEVIRGATMHGAEAIFDPQGKEIEFGLIRPGLLADLVIVEENPVENLKVLYGTGAVKLNDETGKAERVGGVKYTIKDGIIYDAKKLLNDIEEMVRKQKDERETIQESGN